MKSIRGTEGFTLIELLVVIAIIGIIAAIAIPQFTAYRQRSFDTRAINDLRGIATAEEAYFVDNEVYKNCDNTGFFGGASCATLPGIGALSDGVSAAIVSTATGFIGISYHPKGTSDGGSPVGVKAFFWDSSA